MHDEGTIYTPVGHQWNSDSIHVYHLRTIIVQARCPIKEFGPFCHGYDHQRRVLGIAFFLNVSLSCSQIQVYDHQG